MKDFIITCGKCGSRSIAYSLGDSAVVADDGSIYYEYNGSVKIACCSCGHSAYLCDILKGEEDGNYEL